MLQNAQSDKSISMHNSLYTPAVSSKINMLQKVPQLRKIILKYGFGKQLGIFRLHKHYELNNNERIVWSLEKQNCFSSQVTDNEKGTAYALQFDSETKQWLPIEFQTVKENQWENLKKLPNFQSFLEDIQGIIGKDTDVYGLGCHLGEKGLMMETTDIEKRKHRNEQIEQIKGDALVTKYFAQCLKECANCQCGIRCGVCICVHSPTLEK